MSQERVVNTLEAPDELLVGDYGEDIAIRRFGDRIVRVVYKEIEEGVVVFTVMATRVSHRRRV